MPTFKINLDNGESYEVDLPKPDTAAALAAIKAGKGKLLDMKVPPIPASGELPPVAPAYAPGLSEASQFITHTLPSLPPRNTPSAAQAGAEIALGTAGSMAGTVMGGIPGGAAGAFLGTTAGGLVTGRGALDSVIDGVESAVFDVLFAKGAKSFRQAMIPSASEKTIHTLKTQPKDPGVTRTIKTPTSTTTINIASKTPKESAHSLIMGEPTMEPYQRGMIVKKALAANESDIKAVVDHMFDGVRKVAPELDMRDVEQLASGIGVTVPKTGAMIKRGMSGTISDIAGTYPDPSSAFAKVSFEDSMKIRSLLLAQKRLLQSKAPGGGDAIKAAAVAEVEQALEAKMELAAKTSGVFDAWRAANTYFKTEFAERFYRGFVDDLARASGEEIVPSLAKATADEAKTFVKAMTDLGGKEFAGLDVARAGVIARWMKESTSANGALIPQRLDKLINQMDPEVGKVLLGADLFGAIKEFSGTLMKAANRVTLGIGSAGAASVAGGIATTGAPIGAMIGTVEAANELNFLGRLIVNRPSVMRNLSLAVLTGSDEAVRKITGLRTLRILTGQAASGGMRFFGLDPARETESWMPSPQHLLPQAPPPTRMVPGAIRG